MNNMNHNKFGLRECDDEPQVYTLSGIIQSLNEPLRDGADISLECGHWAPARYVAGWICASQNIKYIGNRIKLAWEVLMGRADILYYK